MKHGSLPRSVAFTGEFLGAYAPDGLNETDIDALLTESGIDVDPVDEFEVAPVIPMPTGEPTPSVEQAGGEAA